MMKLNKFSVSVKKGIKNLLFAQFWKIVEEN